MSAWITMGVCVIFSNDNDEIETLLLSAGMNAALFENPRNRITLLQFSQLIKAISKKIKMSF
jgi:hypothetical protein